MSIFGPRTALASFVALPFAVAAFLAGCATASNEVPVNALSCKEIETEIAGTRDARMLAVEKHQDPWKFVIPFAVAGRHVAASSSVGEADRWLAELNAQAQSKGCVVHS